MNAPRPWGKQVDSDPVRGVDVHGKPKERINLPRRRIRILIWSAVGLLAGVLVAWRLPPRVPAAPRPQVDAAGDPIDAGTPLGGTPAPGFTLTDQFGHRHALADFRGHVVALAFIDSRCTTTCPLTAQMLRDAKADLGPAGKQVQLVAVNANPTAVTPADVKAWSEVHHMTDRWLFLTGPAPELKRLYRLYHIAVEVDPDGEVTHTDAVYLLDRRGDERYLFTTDSNFSGTIPEARDLALRLASLLPGHPQVAASAATPAATRTFSLPDLLPTGGTGTLTVGTSHGGPHLVAFFATWCQACQEDLRTLVAYHQQAAERHLPPVVGVDLRMAEPSTVWVRSFLRQHAVDFPVGLDSSGRVMDAYRVRALPYLALVAPGGRILWSHTGVLSLASLRHAVARAAAGT